MQTSVTFKSLDPSNALRVYAEEKLNRLDKYLYNPGEASVVLTVEKFRHIAEINISAGRISINGKEETEDMYSAIDMVLDKLESQIKKSKEKIRDRRSGRSRAKGLPEAGEATDDDAPRQVHIKNIDYKPMDVDEAIMQMDLVDDIFLVFTNARTGRVNVLYRQADGNYGLIQPSR